jgi:hypothetical protein
MFYKFHVTIRNGEKESHSASLYLTRALLAVQISMLLTQIE